MGGSNQSKSAYNQARSQQNWEQNQYTNLTNPGGAISNLAPIGQAGNNLIGLGISQASAPSDNLNTPTGQSVIHNQNNAISAINTGQNAATRQAASAIAGEYSNLLSGLKNQQIQQGGYMPGFGASSEDAARNAADQISLSAIAPTEQTASQLQSQYNTNANNVMQLQGLGLQNQNQGLQAANLGSTMSQVPVQTQLQGLGLTEGNVNNMINTQGKIGANIASPLQTIEGLGRTAAELGSVII